MGMFDSLADKAASALARNQAAFAAAQHLQNKHAAAKPTGDDCTADEIYNWNRLSADNELRIEAAFAAVKTSEQAVERLHAEQAERAADAEHRAIEKKAASGVKRVEELFAMFEKAAATLAAIEIDRVAVENYNALACLVNLRSARCFA